MLSLAVIAMSVGMTAAMSVAFHRTLRIEMLVTGLVCAVVIDRVVRRITRHYRRQLAIANQTLEQRVVERTRELEHANDALRAAATQETVLRNELMMRDRMATAGMLAAGVSHEIRSPLAVITIAVDEAREDLQAGRTGDANARLDDIAESAERIAVILRDLSSLARPADDPMGPVELSGVLDSACRLASYRFSRGVTMERLPSSSSLPRIHGNASRLVQVVLNLLVNAARATEPGKPNEIRVAAVERGRAVVVTVSDTGTGMSTETLARLFEPFFTTGASTGGTGLGLTISRAIVERMGGSIGITSELGTGTTVEITLRAFEESSSVGVGARAA